ncbi:MAG: M20/M25/M40 family metallo-hydrolase [Lachnospiraceae bacterium]|nr:M20/M25/M40 family metallo-hydrolase [Lachnospiraceae bacterium]
MKSDKCAALFARLDELEKEYLRFWIDVCKIESPSEYKEGVDRVGAYFVKKAGERGWKVEVQKQSVSGDCVCITMNPEAEDRPIVFSGHMDTVHPLGLFGDEVVTWDEEKIYGPGVTDCKGGVVAGFYAMAALEDCGFTARPVKLILQSDEEVSSRTSNKETVNYMFAQAENCAAFLNCEPHKDNHITISRKGISRYEFEVKGKVTHALSCYEGASAVREAAYKIIELEKLKDEHGITCNCGLIQGGTAENTVPGCCVFTADVRYMNHQQMAEADRLVEEVAGRSFVEGASCEVTLKSRRQPMERNERNEALLDAINRIYAKVGLPQMTGSHSNGGSDAADMTSRGLPCLDSFGTEGGKIHRREEYAYLRSLKESAKRLAAVAYYL